MMPIDWVSILARIPPDVKRTHHGRSPAEGFDCVGLVLYTFNEAGFPLPDLDYELRDAERLNRLGAIESVLNGCSALVEISREIVWPRDLVGNPTDRDGDLWLLSAGDGLVHAGIQCGGLVWHMGQKLHRRGTERLRAMMKKAYRISSSVPLET